MPPSNTSVDRTSPRPVDRADVFGDLSGIGRRFDSIGANYLLHCLPGAMADKAAAIGNLAPLLNPGGVLFGSTLPTDQPMNAIARRLWTTYNARGVFSNQQDDLEGLDRALRAHFNEVRVERLGTGATFTARVPKMLP